ncbi:MAG: RHS repeat-associated core domain-containing protein [Byssovorax sp.]
MGEVIIHKKYAATQKSGHAAPGPPATSGMLPPTTPSGQPFTPAPFLYVARSAKAHNGTCTKKTKKRRVRFLIEGSVMDVDHPANDPAKPVEKAPPNGADLVTKVCCGQAKVTSTGQSAVTVGQYTVAVVGADVVLNIPTEKSTVHQSQSKLLDAAGLIAAWNDRSKNPAKVKYTGDPVAIASGEVVDQAVDLELFGLIPLRWERHYASGRFRERGPFGKGGFRHAYQQWIEIGERITLHHGDGSRAAFPAIAPREEAFCRGRGLRLRRSTDSYEVLCVHDLHRRTFAPVAPGGPPVLREICNGFGAKIRLDYEDGRLARITDTAGRTVEILHDDRDRITRVEVRARGEVQRFVAYGYDDEGNLSFAENALGERTRYAYDGLHRLIEKTTRAGVRFTYAYHEQHGRCVRSAGPGGLHRVDLQYEDDAGKVLVTGNPEPREYTFDEDGDLLREQSFDGTFALDYEYDDDQLLVAIKDAAGEGTTYTYNELGMLVKSVDSDGFDVEIEYDGGLPVRRREGKEITTFTWDPRGAPASITYPSGATVHMQMDDLGRLVRKIGPDGAIIAQNAYDEEHNLVAVTDGNNATTRFEVDALGQTTAEIDALGRRATWAYDALGRPVTHVMRDGTVIELAWDANDNIVSSGDGRDLSIKTAYRGTGSVARRTMADGKTWEMAYDALERVREIRSPKDEVYELSYDRVGRLSEERTFDGQTVRYIYSKRDMLSRIEHEDDTWIELERDDGGEVARRVTPHGTTIFERDDQGRIVAAVVDEHGGPVVVEVAWDERGNVAAMTQNGRRITYTHDVRGRIVSRTLPNGEVTRYHWDPGGALIGVEHQGEKILLQRDLLGREVRRYAYANGLDIRMGYSDDDRLTDQHVSCTPPGASQAAVLTQRRWEYGPHARLVAAHDARWGTARYLHDPAGRLLEVSRGDRVERFLYDASGWLAGASTGGEPERFRLRMGNVLLRTPEARYEVDLRRRRKKKIDAKTGAETDYVWDCLGQLREVKLPSGERVLFTYDAFGRRVRKAVIAAIDPGSTDAPHVRVVDYVWDFDELAMEIDSDRGERVFVHDPGTFVPMLVRARGETYHVVADRMGEPRELVDAKGRIAWGAAYTAWGKVAQVVKDEGRGDDVAAPFRLLGQYADEETGLAYARHRYFDPDTARWLSPDPLRLRGGVDLFGFDGSPTTNADRLGLYTRAQFKKFLEKYEDKRKKAMQCVADNPSGHSQRTVAADDKGNLGTNGGERDKARSPFGTNRGNDPNVHAEEKILQQDGGRAVGADKPHCPNCTNDIIRSGNVPATSIHPDWNPPPSTLSGKMNTNDPNAQSSW